MDGGATAKKLSEKDTTDPGLSLPLRKRKLPFTIEPTPLPVARRPTQTSWQDLSLPAEAEARKIVQECVEASRERIDLSGLDLYKLSAATLSPLVDFTTVAPTVKEDVPFEQRDPEIKLFLANNALTSLPNILFTVEFLTVLSLRSNNLREIPSCVGQLKRLQSLNASANKLRWLPGELLNLVVPSGSLRELNVHLNPFYQPVESPTNSSVEQSSKDEKTTTTPTTTPTTKRLVGRSCVQYLGVDGSRFSDFDFEPTRSIDDGSEARVQLEPPGELAGPRAVAYSGSQREETAAMGRVPSLVELAVGRAARNAGPASIFRGLGTELAESRVGDHVRRAAAVAESGGQKCSICGREMVLAPRTRWLEFHVLHLESMFDNHDPIPFMRKGCSWRCIPAREACRPLMLALSPCGL